MKKNLSSEKNYIVNLNSKGDKLVSVEDEQN